MKANQTRVSHWITRMGLFALILSLGVSGALVMGETEGLALTDLSNVSAHSVTTTASGNGLYAGLDGDASKKGGIYRSEDNGRTWRFVSAGPGKTINTLATHPTNDTVLFAGTPGGPMNTTESLWASADRGQTWRRFLMGLPGDPRGMLPAVNALATDPNQPDVLYVGTDGRGVYRFDTRCQSFGFELIGGRQLYDANVKTLAVRADGQAYVLTSDRLFVTDGTTSHELPLPEPVMSLAVSPDEAHTLYVGGMSTGVYRTTDGGQSWASINRGLETATGAPLRVTALAIDKQDASHLVAAIAADDREEEIDGQILRSAIYESRDAGLSWIKLANADSPVMELVINRGVVSAVTAAGLTRYPDPSGTSASAFRILRSLVKLNGVQVLILILTASLAGLVLLGRAEWVLRRRDRTTDTPASF